MIFISATLALCDQLNAVLRDALAPVMEEVVI